MLARVIKNCSQILSPLEDSISGLESRKAVTWSDQLESSFQRVKDSLSLNKSISSPRSDDTLWIATDGAIKTHGIGATLYITRGESKPIIAGIFSTKLRKRQEDWLPCELEALAI